MFRNPESHTASYLLAIPVLAALMAGGTAISGRRAAPKAPFVGPTVQIEEAGVLDLSFRPVGGSAEPAQAASVPTPLEVGAAGVMDLEFSPASPEASSQAAATGKPATALDLVPAAGPDLGFTVAQ
jgi:hypothetical protein